MGKGVATQDQEVQSFPYSINPRRKTSRHILIKLRKIKFQENILKAARKKQQITYKGIPIRLSADISAESMKAKREWQDIFKVMKGKNLQPRLLYPARISFRFDGETKSFKDKQKLREFITTEPHLQQMLSNFSRQETQEKKKTYKNKHKAIKKMVIGTYIYIISLNVNGLNAPTKRHRLAEWIQEQDPYICCLQETHFRPREAYRLKVRG